MTRDPVGLRSLTPGFDELVSPPFLREVNTYEHQLAAVPTVLTRMRGRALLADEHFRWRRTPGSRAISMRCLAT